MLMILTEDAAKPYQNGGWYTLTATTPKMFAPNQIPADATVTVYEGCSQKEAPKLSNGAYYLAPGTEYKLYICLPTFSPGSMFMPSFLDYKGVQGTECVDPIVVDNIGLFQDIEAEADKEVTRWYQLNIVWTAPLNITKWGGDGQVVKVVTRHIDCNGTENISNELLPNMTYAKAGINLIGVTVKGSIMFGFQLGLVANCGNRIERAEALELGKKTTLTNAAYTEDKRFVATEAGKYSVVLEGASGTELSVGNVTEYLDENDQVKYRCDFETRDIKATIGENGIVAVNVECEAGETLAIRSDSYKKMEGGLPSVTVQKGTTDIKQTTGNREIAVSENPNDGNFSVTSYLFDKGVEVAVYDMNAKKVYSTTVNGSEAECRINMAGVPAGTYMVVVFGKGRSASTRIIVK